MELRLTKEDLLIFDLNDCLIPCQIRYDLQKSRFLDFLLQQFGQHVLTYGGLDKVIHDFDAFDAARAKEVGFTRTRFQESMRDFYGQVREKIVHKSGLAFVDLFVEAEAVGAAVHSNATFARLLPFDSAVSLLEYFTENNLPRKLLTQ